MTSLAEVTIFHLRGGGGGELARAIKSNQIYLLTKKKEKKEIQISTSMQLKIIKNKVPAAAKAE